MANSNITKNALAQSLKDLTIEKSITKITVGEIADHCGVNRQTFYYHFKEKGELVSWYLNKSLVTPLLEGLTIDNWVERITEMFHLMYKDKEFITNIVENEEMCFVVGLKKVLKQVFEKSYSNNEIQLVGSENEKEVLTNFFAHGLSGIIIDWIKGGMVIDKDNGSRIIKNLVRNIETIRTMLMKNIEE